VSLRIVHRDLKLSNILIHNGEAKIADFGFSKILEAEDQLLQTFAGSPLYMSYQILKQMNYTSKCDIWSLGIIYYELLYGKPPWLAVSILDLLNQIENVPLRFPDKPIVSKQSKDLLAAMLQKDEQLRIGWEELFAHEFFNEKIKMEVEQNLRLSVQQIDGQFKNDLLRKSNAKQKIYFENAVLQNVQHAAKE
jgi:serine/threonine-protein kinase ULK/ATG1